METSARCRSCSLRMPKALLRGTSPAAWTVRRLECTWARRFGKAFVASAKLARFSSTSAATQCRSVEISGLWTLGLLSGGSRMVWTVLSCRSGASAADTADSKAGLPTVSEGLPSTSSNPLAIEVGSC